MSKRLIAYSKLSNRQLNQLVHVFALKVPAVKAARVLPQQLLLQDTLSRSYYVILHAARAALLAEGVTVTSHRGVRILFGQHLIKSGKLPPHLAEILADEQDDRILADYDVLFDPEVDRVQKRVKDADNFLGSIKAFLKKQIGL